MSINSSLKLVNDYYRNLGIKPEDVPVLIQDEIIQIKLTSGVRQFFTNKSIEQGKDKSDRLTLDQIGYFFTLSGKSEVISSYIPSFIVRDDSSFSLDESHPWMLQHKVTIDDIKAFWSKNKNIPKKPSVGTGDDIDRKFWRLETYKKNHPFSDEVKDIIDKIRLFPKGKNVPVVFDIDLLHEMLHQINKPVLKAV